MGLWWQWWLLCSLNKSGLSPTKAFVLAIPLASSGSPDFHVVGSSVLILPPQVSLHWAPHLTSPSAILEYITLLIFVILLASLWNKLINALVYSCFICSSYPQEGKFHDNRNLVIFVSRCLQQCRVHSSCSVKRWMNKWLPKTKWPPDCTRLGKSGHLHLTWFWALAQNEQLTCSASSWALSNSIWPLPEHRAQVSNSFPRNSTP